MGRKRVDACRTPDDFDSVLIGNGAEFIRQNGSYKIYHLQDKTFIVCQHPGDVNKFIRKRLIQMLVAVGVGVLFLVILLSSYI